MQTRRMLIHDYTRVGFYMITILTANRSRLFGVCKNNTITLSPAGQLIQQKWSEIPLHRPAIETSDLIIMPDHIHGIIYVKENLPKPVGDTIRGFKSGTTSSLRKTLNNPNLNVWEEGYHDRVIMNSDTLREERRYIHDNPRRYCMLKTHPALYTKTTNLQNKRLPQEINWTGYGNIFLLDKPEILPIQVSRRATTEEISYLKEIVHDRVSRGTAMISPFISPGEKEIAQMVIENGYGSLILIKPEGFPPLYKPSHAYFDLCAKGRLLVLSPFPYTGRREKLTRDRCIQMNNWVHQISQ